MLFKVTEFRDPIIEVEQVATGHRMTFCVLKERDDLARGSFCENLTSKARLTKKCWRGAYLHAKRAAMITGLIRSVRRP